jgi:hypothetical protein
MSVASALVSGNDALPALAEEALAKALARSGASHATGVLLFLTPDFSRCAQQTVSAVARAAQCTEVAGGIAAGVFSEHGWVIDRPAAAVMVFAGGLSLDHREGGAPAGEAHREAFMSYAGGSFPYPWGDATKRRFGGSFAGSTGGSAPTVWQHSRLAASCSVRVHGARVDIGVSSGWSLLAEPRRIERSRAYDLLSLGGESALDSLLGALPADLREQGPPPLAALSALLIDEESGANRGRIQCRWPAFDRHSLGQRGGSLADPGRRDEAGAKAGLGDSPATVGRGRHASQRRATGRRCGRTGCRPGFLVHRSRSVLSWRP